MGITLHFQSTGTVPGSGAPVTMVGPSLTVGRGAENDLCLPDPGKVISKNHCAIEDRDGNVVVIDLSTNGTFLNYGKTPLGPVPVPLNDGDILTLGSYELMVEIRQTRRAAPMEPRGEDAPPPSRLGADGGLGDLLGDDPAGADDFLDDLLGDGAPLRGHAAVSRPDLGEDGLLPPLGEDDTAPLDPDFAEDHRQGASESTHSNAASDAFRPARAIIPDDFDDDLMLSGGPVADEGPRGTEDAPFAEPAPDFGSAPAFIPEDAEFIDDTARVDPVPRRDHPISPPRSAETQTAPDSGSGHANTPVPPAGDQSAARAFLASLGAADLEISDADLPESMEQLGGVMRVMIEGLRDILMTRASLKSEFRIQQTVIRQGGNNPLKFSISPDQAVEAMVKPRTTGYLEAGAATREALGDIKAHEIAVMTAMEAALKGILQQLSPETLEGQITGSGGLSGLLQGKKARYWDVYEQMYAKISDQAESDFHDVFGREFARAYQAQLERLK
jgi:type VI secretion system FHA domain protein